MRITRVKIGGVPSPRKLAREVMHYATCPAASARDCETCMRHLQRDMREMSVTLARALLRATKEKR